MTASDKHAVESLGELSEKSYNRQRVVAGVVERLQTEVASFTEFIDNIAQRRPPCMSFVTVNYHILQILAHSISK